MLMSKEIEAILSQHFTLDTFTSHKNLTVVILTNLWTIVVQSGLPHHMSAAGDNLCSRHSSAGIINTACIQSRFKFMKKTWGKLCRVHTERGKRRGECGKVRFAAS